MTHDQFEGDAAEVDLCQGAFFALLHRAAIYEDYAAVLQRLRRLRHYGRAHPDPYQRLFPMDLVGARRRLDQLQVELVARTFEQRALGRHAEVLSLGQDREAEE